MSSRTWTASDLHLVPHLGSERAACAESRNSSASAQALSFSPFAATSIRASGSWTPAIMMPSYWRPRDFDASSAASGSPRSYRSSCAYRRQVRASLQSKFVKATIARLRWLAVDHEHRRVDRWFAIGARDCSRIDTGTGATWAAGGRRTSCQRCGANPG
jgi:hypothetical protein